MGTVIIINNKKEQKYTATMMPASKVAQASFIVKETPVVETVKEEVVAPVEPVAPVETVVEPTEPVIVTGDIVTAEETTVVVEAPTEEVVNVEEVKAEEAPVVETVKEAAKPTLIEKITGKKSTKKK